MWSAPPTANWSAREIHLAQTMERVKGSPDIDAFKPVLRQHEREYSSYYGYPPYWDASGLWGMGMTPALLAGMSFSDMAIEMTDSVTDAVNVDATADAHVRSAAELRHYDVQGIDDTIGHVADFLADDATWSVPYLVIDTTNWWFGKQVLLAPQWAHRISWEDRSVQVDMTRETVKSSPEWDGIADLSAAYEVSLADYYAAAAQRDTAGRAKDTSSMSESSSANDDTVADLHAPNPPRTTSFGWLTAPKFGSAGSGGAEIEPGAERD